MNKLTVFYDHIRQASKQENLPFEDICKKLTDVGISGIEADYMDIVGDEGKMLAEKLADLGLPISSVYCHFSWELDPPAHDYLDVLNRLKELNIHNLLAIPGFLKDGQSVEDSISNMIPKLIKLCEAAPSYSVNILMEDYDFKGASFGLSKNLDTYFNSVPGLGCAFDTGNFMYFGENALDALAVLKDRTKYVHCKDRSLTPVDNEEPLEAVTGEKLYSSAVGKGVIPMTEILTTLLSQGYDGPLAIEHFGSVKMLSDMLESATYLNKMLKKDGENND